MLILLAGLLHAQNVVKKVACVGNSITEGFGTSNSSSWPNQLDVRLGDSYQVRNFGIGGRTLLRNGDFPYWDEAIFEAALEFEPDIVIILLGTNDSKPQNWAYKDEFYSDYVDMVNEFRALNSKPEIFTGFPPPVFEDGFGITNSIIRDEIIPLIDSVRTTLKTFQINFYDNMTEMGSMFPDGIHPDAAGYTEMAKIAEQAILIRPSGYIKYFSAYPEVVEEDGSSVLYWAASESSQVDLDGQPVAIEDSMTVSPLGTKEYILTAAGELADTAVVRIDFLPSGNVKSFKANPHLLEAGTGESSILSWQTSNNSQVWLDGNSVQQNDSLVVTPSESSTYTLVTIGADQDTSEVLVSVLEPDAFNRSLVAVSYNASSTEYQYSVSEAFDSNPDTYWMSDGHATEWISIDLGRELYLNHIRINWADVYASSYRIEVLDAENTLNIFHTTTSGDGGLDDIARSEIKGKLIRLLCFKSSSTELGYKVKELEIYGSSRSFQAISDQRPNQIPEKFTLFQNAPNPFNPETMIRYTLPVPSQVSLELFDIRGAQVGTLVDQFQPAGAYQVYFNGSALASGFYFYRLKADNFEDIRKMLIVR